MIQFPMEILRSLYYLTVIAVLTVRVLCSDPLSEALLSFKSVIIDDFDSLNDWTVPSGVNSSAKIVACSWNGVKCDQNSSKIVGLDLSVKNLKGSLFGKEFNFTLFVDLVDLNLSHNSFSDKLPAEISTLVNLKSFDISRNNFSGHFPSGFSKFKDLIVLDAFSNSFSGPLPVEVSEIQSLKVLNFAGSYFSGPIPSEYGSFKSLEFIHLAGNDLNGKIPPELGKMKTLSHMEIGYNRYEGEIPWQFGNMSELKYLDIADANLYGSIPVQLSNLTKLESLFLFSNHLTGNIPWEFSKILPLSSLDLSDNLLFGKIPDSFSEMKNLTLLSLMYNHLDGFVPEGIAKLPQLDTLLLWNNNFSGFLPQDLGRYSKLKYLDVSTNNFAGRIPPDICSGGELVKLILFSNNFSEGLSPSLSNCSSLVRVRLEDNSFSGDLSLKFSNLPDLSYLDLSRNRFTGGIPIDIDQASKLQYFNVSNNQFLGGVIPVKTWSMPLLENFSVVSCGISGNIPSFEHCKSLSVIELSENNLSGVIPESISYCKELVGIDLANNTLTGPIPVELAKLPDLGVIDLSRNSLTGPIPAEFGKSSSLTLLNVSYNDLWGLIPPRNNFRLMDKSAFIGNPKLCGAPLRRCHRETIFPDGLALGSTRTQDWAWVLIICAVVVLFIVTLIFGILYFKRGSKTKNQWKMVSFSGFPEFRSKDVLRSFNSFEVLEEVTTLPDSISKVVLPTGITVSVKKIEWEPKTMDTVLQFLHRIGNARHNNLTRLLGICYNTRLAYLSYDYLPNGNLSEKISMKRDWPTKYKMVIGIAKGLCFLHHDCHPAIPHGNLKTSNVMFDENMEPRLVEYGLKSIVQLARPLPAKETGELGASKNEELYMDIQNFGDIVFEILTNGRLVNGASSIRNTSKEILVREIVDENDIDSNSFREEIKLVLEVALLCTTSRPSMEDALKMLQGLKPQTNGTGP